MSTWYSLAQVTCLISLGLPKCIRPCLSAFRFCFVKLRQDGLSIRYTLAKASLDGIKPSEITSEKMLRDLLC